MTAADDHCRDLVRRGDWNRYVASLFAPDGARPHLLALYAFDAEIARIASAVSEPQLGLIRQQWWLDTLSAMEEGKSVGHPVAEALAVTVRECRLPLDPLRQLVIAREGDLVPAPPADLGALEAHLGATSSAVIQLAAMILAGADAAACAEAAGLAGVADGLTRGLSAPRAGALLLPAEMDATAAAAHARRRLGEARRAARAMPRAALPAFLAAGLADLYLDNLQRPPSRVRRQLALWWRARHDRF